MSALAVVVMAGVDAQALGAAMLQQGDGMTVRQGGASWMVCLRQGMAADTLGPHASAAHLDLAVVALLALDGAAG